MREKRHVIVERKDDGSGSTNSWHISFRKLFIEHEKKE